MLSPVQQFISGEAGASAVAAEVTLRDVPKKAPSTGVAKKE